MTQKQTQRDTQRAELPAPGRYLFQVREVTRETYQGRAGRIPSCPAARVALELTSEEGGAAGSVTDTLYLARSLEWRLSAFFRSLGRKQRGLPYRMDWDTVPGARGVLEIYGDEDRRGVRYIPQA